MLGIIHANKQLSLLLPFLSHNGSAAVNGSVAGKLVLSPVQWQNFVIIRLLEDLWIGIRPPFVVAYPGPGATFVVGC